MINAYIYPFSSRGTGPGNPYLKNFIESLSENVNFVNIRHPSSCGLLDIFKYTGKIELLFLNWIEDLPEKKGGVIQTALFYLLLIICKIKRIRIFYTFHNKQSHYSGFKALKQLIRKSVINNADFILCHASEGYDILKSFNAESKTMILHHPFAMNDVSFEKKDNAFDILIWGAIKPYKAIDKFLEYLSLNKKLESYRIMIIGKIIPENYENEFNRYQSEKIKIINYYADDEQLNDLISKSSIVLFTYSDKSVLSSGALVYSLTKGAFVIGPATGSFMDLYNEGVIEVYYDYPDLVKKIDRHPELMPDHEIKLREYIERNTWEKFGEKIFGWIGKKEMNGNEWK